MRTNQQKYNLLRLGLVFLLQVEMKVENIKMLITHIIIPVIAEFYIESMDTAENIFYVCSKCYQRMTNVHIIKECFFLCRCSSHLSRNCECFN